MVARQLRNEVHGHADRISDWLVLRLDHVRQEAQQVVLCEQLLLMFGVYPSCHLSGVWQFAGITLVVLVIGDRKRPDRLSLIL